MGDLVLFKSEELLPAAWRDFSAAGPVRIFNPALLADGAGWLFAYRVVGPDRLRRIGLCQLDAALRVVADSPLALTDLVRFSRDETYAEPATTWFADPRLYRLGGRLFIYWNSGWHEPRNYQFLQELDRANFHPIGAPREMVLRGARQKLEKNWTLFEADGLHAVYSINPHRILNFSLDGSGAVEFVDETTHAWNTKSYANTFGELRGGAPPQLLEGEYWSFCHSVSGTDGNYRYVPVVYRFAASPPFAPTAGPTRPLAIGGEPAAGERRFPKLNPAVGNVVYPCGAAFHRGQWLISLGLNDERCAIARLEPDEVKVTLQPELGNTSI